MQALITASIFLGYHPASCGQMVFILFFFFLRGEGVGGWGWGGVGVGGVGGRSLGMGQICLVDAGCAFTDVLFTVNTSHISNSFLTFSWCQTINDS